MKTVELNNILEGLKYTERFTYTQFISLLFPDSPDEQYNKAKWHLFATDRIRFLWSCSNDKLEILCQHIREIQYRESQGRV